VVISAVFVLSAGSFLLEGGFGGGHGNLDIVIFVVGLPWDIIPWPPFVAAHDFVWLIVLPLVLDVAVFVVAHLTFARSRERRSAAPRVRNGRMSDG
jgi:hypothetical protein